MPLHVLMSKSMGNIHAPALHLQISVRLPHKIISNVYSSYTTDAESLQLSYH